MVILQKGMGNEACSQAPTPLCSSIPFRWVRLCRLSCHWSLEPPPLPYVSLPCPHDQGTTGLATCLSYQWVYVPNAHGQEDHKLQLPCRLQREHPPELKSRTLNTEYSSSHYGGKRSCSLPAWVLCPGGTGSCPTVRATAAAAMLYEVGLPGNGPIWGDTYLGIEHFHSCYGEGSSMATR